MCTRKIPGATSRAVVAIRRTAIGCVLGLALVACSKPAPAPEPVRSVRTITVAAGQLGGTVEYAAEVRAQVEARLAFRVAGKMIDRRVGLGEQVRAGQALASLDAQDLRLGQDAARSSVQAARVTHDQAQADFKRFKELRDQGFISAAELERRESTARAAQAQLDQAQALAGVQTNQARYSTLVADSSGVVTSVEAEPGAVLSAGTTVLRVARDGPRDVVFSVPEDQVAAIRAMQGRPGALQVRVWGAAGALLPATLREVAAAADPVTRTFAVKADIGEAAVRLGQTATVSIAMPAAPDVIKLPLAAVFEHQGKTSVWLLDTDAMSVKLQSVQVVAAEGNQVVVGSGLTPGDRVVSAGVHVLTPGQKVSLYEPGQAVAASPASGTAR